MIATAVIVGAAIAIAETGVAGGTIGEVPATTGAPNLKIANPGPKAAAASAVQITDAIIVAMTGAVMESVTTAAAIIAGMIIVGTTVAMTTGGTIADTTVGAITDVTITAGIIVDMTTVGAIAAIIIAGTTGAMIDEPVIGMAAMDDTVPQAIMVTALVRATGTAISARCTISSTTIRDTTRSDGLW